MKKRPAPTPPAKSTPPAAAGTGKPAPTATTYLGFGLVVAAFVGLVAWGLWPRQTYTEVPVEKPAPAAAPATPRLPHAPFVMPDQKTVYATYAGSKSCQECHAGEYEKWASSHHGLAERKPDPALDLAAFVPARSFDHGTQTTEVRQTADGAFELVSLGFDNQRQAYPVQRVIGHDPLRQFLVQGQGGRLHAMEACFDPNKKDWFNVYGNEDRKPGEWGHWTGRGMVWNQMCASCHNTRVRKNYDLATDSYHTAMTELTVSCESCHGPMKEHDDWQRRYKGQGLKDPTLVKWTRDQHIDNCAGCHARRGEVTGDFVPGESFWDHYQLTITDGSDIYYPDGQIRDENYEFASFLSSRMYHAGVRCMDCHDMHSMKTILPGNQLCMRCHTAGGFPNAPAILPEVHSFHQAQSTGNQCINCHMPQTVYMQRHPRHDHGFTIPDPLLTKQHGVPNACNKCHTDKDVDWALQATQKWWGPRMDRKTRARAQLVAGARQGDEKARDGLVALLGTDEIPHWKASASLLLDRWADQPPVQDALKAQLQHPHPLVRQSALRALEPLAQDNSVRSSLAPLLEDPARSVRVSAAWALRHGLNTNTAAAKDLTHMLELNADQPAGQMQLGQFRHSQGDLAGAIRHMETAVRWDPNSPPFHHDLAMLHNAAGDNAKTIASLRAAIQLDPNVAEYHYSLGLALSETGDLDQVIAAMREVVRLQPGFSRAWYNLGLALNGQKKTAEALQALQQGEAANRNDPMIPYARATILASAGRVPEALMAAERALQIQPDMSEARQLIFMLRNGRPGGR